MNAVASTPRHTILGTIPLALLAFGVIGCSAAGTGSASAGPTSTVDPTPSQPVVSFTRLPVPAGMVATSATKPDPEAAAVFAKCHIGDTIPMGSVIGMGKVGSAKDVTHFVPLTGREPALKAEGPVWIIQIRGDFLQQGNEIWTDPTCIVTTIDFGLYGTGLTTDSVSGKTSTPEPPAIVPDEGLPPLAP